MARKKFRRSTVVSDNCFRLLSLKHEFQYGAIVTKSVVNEVDVLRLCRSLGMAVSDEDNREMMHKFEFGEFDPSKYDAEFARFIRGKLAVGSDSCTHHEEDQTNEELLGMCCLFGRQSVVVNELNRLGLWDRNYESDLPRHDQGVFCIERHERVGDHRQFVAFAWLGDSLFEPDRIRDTSTYVLRFLMSLCSNVTCCLSREDVDLIESEVHAAANSNMEKQLNSSSVEFRVQQTEEQSDTVGCAETRESSLPRLGHIKNVVFVDGVFPAIAVERSTSSTTEMVTASAVVQLADFADWVFEKHLQFDLELPRDERSRAKARDCLLDKFNHLPEVELIQLEYDYDEQLAAAKQRIGNEVSEEVQYFYESMSREAHHLFASGTLLLLFGWMGHKHDTKKY